MFLVAIMLRATEFEDQIHTGESWAEDFASKKDDDAMLADTANQLAHMIDDPKFADSQVGANLYFTCMVWLMERGTAKMSLKR